MNPGYGLGVGIICAPFISVALYALHRAGRALHPHHTRTHTRSSPMSIYASIEGIGDHGDPEHLGAPWEYQGSHIPPHDDHPRNGSISLAVIPSHITADGRDDQPSDGTPWPWLRLALQDVPSDDPCVLIDPAQARFLADQLATWAHRAEAQR